MTHRWMIAAIVTLAVLVTAVSNAYAAHREQELQHQTLGGGLVQLGSSPSRAERLGRETRLK